MKDFAHWFAEQGKESESMLPEGVIEENGLYLARCVGCESWKEIFCDISEVPDTGYMHYCGGNPWCCP